MKKLLILFIFPLLFACSKEEEENYTQKFKLFGDEVKIPLNYFEHPYVAGTVKGTCSVNLETNEDVNGYVVLYHIEDGRTFEYVRYVKYFTLKKGQIFEDSGDFSFHGHRFDKVFIVVNIEANTESCPARIVSSSVRIIDN